jgi:hypothetical protein
MIFHLMREERGMVLGLAIIIVVVIGVMGAGLLTFVSADLQAVVTVNRGEQAFQLAEAGVEVARAHLAGDPSPSDWSSGELHMDGVEDNSVSVTVEHVAGSVEVISTGPVWRDEAQDRSRLHNRRRQTPPPRVAGALRVGALTGGVLPARAHTPPPLRRSSLVPRRVPLPRPAGPAARGRR